MSELPIIFQDEHVVVVNKFSGLLVHASKVNRAENKFALQMLRDQIGKRVFLVHRLDRATSGALLFATSSEMAALLCEQFANRTVEKKYLAIVRGQMQDADVDYPLKEIVDKMTDKRAKKNKPAQAATTKFKVLAHCEINEAVDRYPTARYSLIEAKPLTGRKHQIRRHLKHISHPIVGDVNYGVGAHNRFFRDRFSCSRLLLACTQLSFNHPLSGEKISVEAPLDEDFKNLIANLGLC